MIWLLKQFHNAVIEKLGDIDAEEFMRFLKLVDLYARVETLRFLLILLSHARRNGLDIETMENIIGDLISDFDSEIDYEIITMPIFEHYYKLVKEKEEKEEVGSKPAGA